VHKISVEVIYYVLEVLHSEGGGKRKKEREKKRWRENEGS